MTQEYIKPTTAVLLIASEGVICGSDERAGICNSNCKFWHMCRDRDTRRGEFCIDKEYKY